MSDWCNFVSGRVQVRDDSVFWRRPAANVSHGKPCYTAALSAATIFGASSNSLLDTRRLLLNLRVPCNALERGKQTTVLY